MQKLCLSSMIMLTFVAENAICLDRLLHMKLFLIHKRVHKGWIWLKRFRHRKGYGVHSPFAFDFITRVIYGKSLTSGSRSENNRCHTLESNLHSVEGKEPKKVRKLLIRLEKEASPFIYLNHPDDPIYINKVYEEQADKMAPKGMMVIYGIYKNPQMKDLWKKLMTDSKSGITFDLYDVGIILFDKNITKQDYIVNF